MCTLRCLTAAVYTTDNVSTMHFSRQLHFHVYKFPSACTVRET